MTVRSVSNTGPSPRTTPHFTRPRPIPPREQLCNRYCRNKQQQAFGLRLCESQLEIRGVRSGAWVLVKERSTRVRSTSTASSARDFTEILNRCRARCLPRFPPPSSSPCALTILGGRYASRSLGDHARCDTCALSSCALSAHLSPDEASDECLGEVHCAPRACTPSTWT